MIGHRLKIRAKRSLRRLSRHRLWLFLAVACVAVVFLAILMWYKGGQWYKSPEGAVGLAGLLVSVGSLIYDVIQSRQQPANPFVRCTTAKVVKENLLHEDDIGSLGMCVDYLPRRRDQIDAVLRRSPTNKKRNVLVAGSDCSGKTRELVEIANRHLLGGSEALVFASDELPRHIRLNLRGLKRKVFLFADDIQDLCRQHHSGTDTRFTDELGNIVQKRLKKRLHKDVSVVASCAFYPSALDDIEWNGHQLWESFELIPLGFLSESELEIIAGELSTKVSLELSDSQRHFMVENNTGVFVPILELFNRAAKSAKLDDADLAWYAGRLRQYWETARHRWTQEIPLSDTVFKAMDVLQQLGIDLLEDLVAAVAVSISGHSEEEIRKAMTQLGVFALPPSDEYGQIRIFRGQADLGYRPESEDEFRAIADALVKYRTAINPEILFDTALDLASNYGEVGTAIDLWYSVLDMPLLAPPAQYNTGVAMERKGDELQATMYLAKAIADRPELAVHFAQDGGYVTRSEWQSLCTMPPNVVSDCVAETVSCLCGRFLESKEVAQLYRELLLRLSAKGVECAPNSVKVRFVRCRVLDILKKHPDIVDELEQLVGILLSPDFVPLADLLWEAALMQYKWAEQTAEWRLQTHLREREYVAQANLANAKMELQFIRTRLRNEHVKEERGRTITEEKRGGTDIDNLPQVESSQVDWFLKEEREAEAEVQAAEEDLSRFATDISEIDILLEENEEYEQALAWAREARKIDPTIGNENFINYLESLLTRSN